LGIDDELTVGFACVMIQAGLTVGPVRHQNHHPSAFFSENRMTYQSGDVSDVILHFVDDFPNVVISEHFTDDHLCIFHERFSFRFGL
jgi:hypothetical protein